MPTDRDKSNIQELTQIVAITPEKKIIEILATEMLQSGMSEKVYEILPIKDIVLYKIRAGMPLHDDEIAVVENLMK